MEESARVRRASSITWADIALGLSPCPCLAWPQPQEVVRQLIHEWSTCPESQKGPWVAKALYDRERYCRDMASAEYGHSKPSRLIEAGRSASGTLRCVVYTVCRPITLSRPVTVGRGRCMLFLLPLPLLLDADALVVCRSCACAATACGTCRRC